MEAVHARQYRGRYAYREVMAEVGSGMAREKMIRTFKKQRGLLDRLRHP
jgi:hypothetical protein